MNLLVHTTSLIPPLTGIGHYTHQMLKCLINDRRTQDIRAFNPMRCYSRPALHELIESLSDPSTPPPAQGLIPSSATFFTMLRKAAAFAPGARRLKQAIQQRVTADMMRHSRHYIYWEPNYILQPFEGSTVTTIHDLSHIRYPEYHPRERVQWLENHLSESLARANAIVAVSNFSRKEIVDVFKVASNRITIVRPAVSDAFRQSFTSGELIQLRHSYQLPVEYIFSVGTLEPRKNVTGLVKAFGKLPSALRRKFPLVLAGYSGWNNEGTNAMLQPYVQRGEIIRLGYVPQSDLPKLYAAASLFAYVSFYEGYGMPIAEAMASGVAIVASDRASMPEVAAGCAELVNPDDIDSISAGLRLCLENREERVRRAGVGRQKSAAYTWQNSAERLIQLFSSLQVAPT